MRNKVVPENIVHKAIIDELHETMQDKLDLKDNDCCIVPNERFKKYLDTIKHN